MENKKKRGREMCKDQSEKEILIAMIGFSAED